VCEIYENPTKEISISTYLTLLDSPTPPRLEGIHKVFRGSVSPPELTFRCHVPSLKMRSGDSKVAPPEDDLEAS